MTGTFGLGLVLMALRITARKNSSEELARLLERGSALLVRLSAFADEDVGAFERYIGAVRMPKATEAELAAREHARSEAAKEATRVPLEAAEAMVACLELAIEARPQVAGTISADVFAGADLLGGALRALMRSVSINLASIEDLAVAATLAERQKAAEERARELQEELRRTDDQVRKF